MTRFMTSAAVVAFTALSAVAANAADLGTNATANPAAANAAETSIPSKDILRAGDVYTQRELMTVGLTASDLLDVAARDQVEIRADEVYTQRELDASGLNADEIVTGRDFSADTANATRGAVHGWRADR